MNPRDFPESNDNLRGSHITDHLGRQLGDMRAYRNEHETISCWRLTWRERLSALAFGKVWLCVLGHRVPPVSLNATRTMFVKLK